MNLYQWRQSGRVYLWYYRDNPKNYTGWHICADKAGAQSLIDLFSLMAAEEKESRRSLTVSAPNEKVLLIPNCNSVAVYYSKLSVFSELNYQGFSIAIDGDRVNMVLDSQWLKELKSGFVGMLNRKGDFSIGYNNSQLWFWWCI